MNWIIADDICLHTSIPTVLFQSGFRHLQDLQESELKVELGNTSFKLAHIFLAPSAFGLLRHKLYITLYTTPQ
jgi:hypothetical protein